MFMFMSKQKRAEEKERLIAERSALIKKAQETESKKGEKFAWAYWQQAEQAMERIAKL